MPAAEISDLVSVQVPIRPPTGYEIALLTLAKINPDQVRRIIESGFGERLVKSYFNDKAAARFLLEIQGRGVAVLMDDYLDMFAVHAGWQENGIGAELLARVRAETNDRFYLR